MVIPVMLLPGGTARRKCGAGAQGAAGAACGCHLHRRSPARVPSKHKALSSPEVVYLSQELIRSQHHLLALLAEIGGELFDDLLDLLRRQVDILITAGQRHEQLLILRLHQFSQQLAPLGVEPILVRHLQMILDCDSDVQDDGIAFILVA